MLKRIAYIFTCLLISGFSLSVKCQNKIPTCAELKTGFFYSYPKNSPDPFLYQRDNDIQKEINIKTSDTLFWKVNWLSECTYSLKYISGCKDKALLDFARKHIVLVSIKKITEDYFTYDAFIDKLSNLPVISDTQWITEKVNYIRNKNFDIVEGAVIPGKKQFNNTSKYALLYIYRPGKFTNSLGNYIIYINDYAACAGINNTGYLFKVYNEGPLEIKSRLLKDESSVKLYIKFGQKYYVKSMINWALTSRLYNFKLDMKEMVIAEGEAEFEEVNIK